MEVSKEIFSFHLMRIPLVKVPGFFFGTERVLGLHHCEKLLTMHLGAPVLSVARYDFRRVAILAWWKDEDSLDQFLASQGGLAREAWHVRMRLYRRWGQLTELSEAAVYPDEAERGRPVIAVTVARLRLLQTVRFIRWGKPVERQVRDHSGQSFALAAMRPLNTFSTFSIWKNENEMINMVHGRKSQDGESHRLAMLERARKDFHFEFSTMRFIPLKEGGAWQGRSNYLCW